MANTVGSVAIDLEARIAKFESDLGRAARIAEQRSAEMRKTLGAVAGALGAGLSVMGVTAWVKSAIDAQDEISKLSQKVSVSTQVLSGWQLAAKQAGVDSAGLQTGLVKLAQASQAAAEGSKQQANAFKTIGVSVTDAHGKLKPMQALFEDVAGKLAKYKDSTEKTVIATRLFGKAGAELIPLLNSGKEGLAEYVKMADDFGLTVGGKAAKAAERFNDSVAQLGLVSKGVANQIATALAPAMADLSDKAVAFFRSDTWKRALDGIATGVKYVVDHVGDLVNALKLLGEILTVVYVSKALRFGAEWVSSLLLQIGATKGLAAAQLSWGEATAASFAAAKKEIGLIGIAFKLLGSAVIGWQIGKYLSDQFLEVRLAGIALVSGLLKAWESIKYGAQVAWNAIAYVAKLAIDGILNYFAKKSSEAAERFSKLPDWLGGAKIAGAYASLAAALKPASDATDDYNAKMADLTATHQAALKAIDATSFDMWQYEVAQDKAKNATTATTAAIDKQKPSMAALAGTTDAAATALAKYNQQMDTLRAKLADVVHGYAGKIETPDIQAWNDYAQAVRKAAEASGQQIAASRDALRAGTITGAQYAKAEADAQNQLADGLTRLSDAYKINADEAQRRMRVGEQSAIQMRQEAQAYLMDERSATIYRAGLQAENTLRQSGIKYTAEFIAGQRRAAEAGAAYAYDLQKQAEFAKQVAQEYTGFWENAASSIARAMGDLFTGQTKKFKDFGQSLKSIAQQFVSDIVSQFLRLRILGPILNGAMGSMAGWLGIGAQFLGGSSITESANYYGNGGTIGQSPGAVGGAGGAGGYAGYLQNGMQAYKAYQWAANGGLWGSGLAGGAGNVSQVGIQGMTYGVNGATGGTAVAFNPYVTSYSPVGGTFGIGGYSAPYASAAGGLLGAYYGSQRGGGGFSTVASTASYGALGAGIAGTAAGVAGGASLGTAAGSAFGAAAAGTSWIPIVGWIMAGLAALDSFSGGKVFGTGWKPAQSNVTLGLGADGASASANETMWKYKGQTGLSLGGFLTGGLSQLAWWGDKKTKVQQLDVTPEMLAAAQALYDSMEKVLVSGAQKLGIDAPEMIQASITAQTTYDKKGKASGTKYLVQYLGQTWEEATAEAASQRLGADALLSVVAKSAGDVAFQIAKQWQASADILVDGVQTLLQAQQDIVRGNSFIALGSSATLKQVVAFVQGLQADGEKLADTYNRLMQASQAYVQFVGQFAPTSNSFGAALEAIAKQMQANIDQANALAQAAGMQHAAEQDLVNIHQFAAKQAADAIAQLSSAAQDLATKLYGVTNNSLQAVSAQLDKLAGKTQSALQLAIGDNSPLGGKEKLDLALQGLRSGLTSADDVLALGRKLYASSADYTGLFNKVQEILGNPGATGQQSLQDAIKQYTDLAAQRDQLQGQADASARFADAKTLAQYIADISTTHGIDYAEAAKGLGFNLADLAKDLGVSNLTGYLDSLKLQDIPGSLMQSSSSIVDAIQKLGRDLIQTLTGAPITTVNGATGSQATATAEQTALLKSIDARLAAIEGSSSDTANTNKTMAAASTRQALDALALSNRGVPA